MNKNNHSSQIPVNWEVSPSHPHDYNYRFIEKGAWKKGLKPMLQHLRRTFFTSDPEPAAQNNLALMLLLVLLIFFTVIAFLSAGTYGGGDDLHHYRLARYAFRYPGFFLDYWGKPLFTILSSPFAQFGHNGAKFFNVLAGILTAYFTFKLARVQKQQNAILIIFFVLFAPVFASLIPSSMTEITGSLCLALALFQYFRGSFGWAAFVISFIPMARTEGMLIMPLFLLMFILHRKWKAIPWLFVGPVLFSFIGWAHYGDFFWILTKIPYGSFSAELYGSGSLFFYIENAGKIIGVPLAVLFGIGAVYHLYQLFHSKFSLREKHADEFFLLFSPVVLVLAFHSLAWYLGTGALALYRFVALVIPPAVYFSLAGYNLLEKLLLFNFKALRIVLRVIVLALVIRTAFEIYQLPVPLSQNAEVLKEACTWISKEKLDREKVYFYDPNVFFFLDIDPQDFARIQEKVPDAENPAAQVEPGSIVVWDAHFGPNEGRLPIERLLENSDYTLMKKFEPRYPFKVMGGHDYAVYVFQKK